MKTNNGFLSEVNLKAQAVMSWWAHASKGTRRTITYATIAVAAAGVAFCVAPKAHAADEPTYDPSSVIYGYKPGVHVGCLRLQPKGGSYGGQSESDKLANGNAWACAQAALIVDSDGVPVDWSSIGGGGGSGGAVTQSGSWLIGVKGVDGSNIAANANPVPISDAGGSLTVDGTVASTQSGTWNVTNISGTVSLPTGASTSALQSATQTPITPATATATAGVLQGCEYRSTKPTFTNTQQGSMQCGSRGQLTVSLTAPDSTTGIESGTNTTDGQGGVNGLAVISYGRVFNGTNNDRIRSVVNGTDSTGTGIQAVGTMAQCDNTSPNSVTENQFGNLRMTCGTRALLTKPYESRPNTWSYAAPSAGLNSTTAVTFKAAAGGTSRNCITSIQITLEDAATIAATSYLTINDGAAGTSLWGTRLSASASGIMAVTFPVPICGSQNTLLEVQTTTATGAANRTYFNAQGYVTAE